MSQTSIVETALGATPPTKKICHVYAVGGNSIAMGKLQVNSDVSGDPGLSAANKTKYWKSHTGVWVIDNWYMNYYAADRNANKYNMDYVKPSNQPFSYGDDIASSQYSAGMVIFPKIKELYLAQGTDIDIAYCQVHSLGVGFTQTAYDNFNLNMTDPVYLSKNLTKILGRNLALTVRHMEAMGYDVRVKGVLMIGQGVADCWDLRNGNITAANLNAAITAVINYFRTTLGYTDVPFYICQTTQTTAYANEANIYEGIIKDINTAVGNVYFHQPKLWATLVDGTHINGLTGVDAWGEGADVSGNKNMAKLIHFIESAAPPNGSCSSLVVSVVSGSSLKLDWVNGSTDEENIIVERSSDGSVYVEIATLNAGVETYTDTNLLRNNLYYYRVRAIKDLQYSDYSNVDSDTTANTGPDGSVTSLALTTLSDTSIKLDWTNGSTDEDGIVIERSLLGVIWTVIHTTAAGVATYTDTGLSPTTRYYYRCRAVKAGDYSNYSNTANDYTAMLAVISAAGNGTGVATFQFTPTGNVVANIIDGNAKFYSDSAGTLNESTSFTFTTSSKIRYVKCTSGSSNMLLFAKNNITSIDAWTTTTHAPSFYTIMANLPRSMTALTLNGNNSMAGTPADLPPNLTTLYIGGQNIMSGNVWYFPLTMTYVRISASRIADYTADRVWNNSMNYVRFEQSASYGFSLAEQISIIKDLDIPAWAGASRNLYFGANNASLADTNQGGIWGDFSGTAAPSLLAIALKSIVKTKSVTFTATGMAIPGASGDGTGFPAGFGDWWRA